MNKHERAQYLVNIMALMDSQVATGNQASATLRGEYEREWGNLKKEIESDEARSSNKQHVRAEDGAEQPRGERLDRR